MLFNSYVFIFLFLPVTFFSYFILNKWRLTVGATTCLVVASLFYYSWYNIIYLPLILISMVFNYVIGESFTHRDSAKKVSRKVLLVIGIIVNLGLLGYFKYFDFFLENINLVDGANFAPLNLALPLGISFFTFQQIAYIVDFYKGQTREYNFLKYALFVSFFPQLIAGPIVHHKEMMPQYDRLRSKLINPRNVALGLFVFSIGLFKKVAIADQFAIWATNGFDNAEVLPLIEAWITSLSYTLQLYFDFSGYTDMAVGVAMLFNIRLPNNFNSPYKALDIQDFWRRWHITLSRFLKDYVYIPLGGNRSGNLRTHVNLMTTFILGGIWHGAGWTFIAWGALHGIALVIHRIWKQLGLRLHPLIAWFITFNFVNIAWVFFRAREWADAYKVLKGMFGGYGLILPAFFATHLEALSAWGVEFGGAVSNVGGSLLTPVWVVLCLLLVVSTPNSSHQLVAFIPSRRTLVFSGILFALGVLSLNNVSEFLYFDF